MKTLALCSLAAVTLSFGSAALATGAGMSVPAAVPSYYAPREAGVDFVLPGTTSPMACALPSTFRVYATAQNYNAIVAAIMTAFSTQKKIQVWAYQCDADGAALVVAAFVYQ